MENKELLTAVYDFLDKVVRDCQDGEMCIEASNLADRVWDVLQMDKESLKSWETSAERKFEGDIIITDPCYLDGNLKVDDWQAFVTPIIAEGGMMSRTYCGDWGCTTYEFPNDCIIIPKDAKIIGKFCADAGMVCVVELDKVLEKNPNFKDWIAKHDTCVTVIKGFSGYVKFLKHTEKKTFGDGTPYDSIELRIRGEGTKDGQSFCFETKQTSM